MTKRRKAARANRAKKNMAKKTARGAVKKKSKMSDAATQPPAAVLPEPTLAEVKVGDVAWPGNSGRVAKASDLGLDELAASLAEHGQIDPIIVITRTKHGRGPGKGNPIYEGVDGYRRCTAMKDGDKLRALIYPTTCEGRADEIRTAAIVQTLPHSDVEKALMVGRLVDDEIVRLAGHVEGDVQDVAIAKVADRLNKPVRFVQDYRYLTRLSKNTRSLLEERRLTLAAARELATISDHEVQDEIADQAASNVGGGFGRDLGWVTRQCREVRRNLKVIAWRADVKFAGKPACVTCPNNTANDRLLYAHDAKESARLGDLAEERSGLGMCTLPACFEHKAKAAEQARGELEKKAAAIAKKQGSGHAADLSQIAQRVVNEAAEKKGLAAGLKESIAIRTAREAAESASPRAKAGTDDAPGSESRATGQVGTKASKLDSVRTVEQKAQERFDEAKVHWQGQVRKAIFDELGKRPGGLLLLGMMIETGELRDLESMYQGADVEKKMAVKITSPSSAKAVEPLMRLAKLTELDLTNTKAGEVLGMLSERCSHKRVAYWFDEAQGFIDMAADCVALFILKAIDWEAGDKAATAEPKLETFLAEAGVGEKPGVSDEDVKRVESGLAAEWDEAKRGAGKKRKGKKAEAGELEPAAAGVGGEA